MKKANNSNLWHYNHNLQNLANQNRKKMTKAEASIWKYVLSKKQLNGYQFRRQRPVLNYITDFMCKELMLIIEIDGLTHQWEEIIKNDLVRENDLKNIGFTIIRFNDGDVLNNINMVIQQIKDLVAKIESKLI